MNDGLLGATIQKPLFPKRHVNKKEGEVNETLGK